ncbi:MAG: GNAT family N-acetyltransferase [Caldilinea sp.]
MTVIPVPGYQYDQRLETGIRPFDIGRDLRAVAELISVAFAAELDDRGSAALREMRTMSHFGGLLGVLNRSTGEFNDLLNGFVWVEQGHVVGNITVQRADKYATRWQIANVAVAPGFRGRGISRRLMEVALDHATRAGGLWAVLQVYQANTVAYHLYKSLGFDDVTAMMDLRAPRAPLVSGLTPHPLIKPFAASDWQSLYELVNHQLGSHAQWWRSIRRTDFQATFEDRLGEWFWRLAGRGVHYRRVIQNSPRFEAALLLDARRWRGEHCMQLWVRPEQYGSYDRPLIDWALWQLQHYPRWPIRISVCTEHRSAIDYLVRSGFAPQRTLVTMRRRLAEDADAAIADERP